MGGSSRFFSEGVGWLGAVFVLGITVSVAPPSILATERAALMPDVQTTWSAGGDDEEASSTANEVVRASMASHNQKSDDGEEDGFDPKKNRLLTRICAPIQALGGHPGSGTGR